MAELDGRTARAMRTRRAIVDACLSLVDEGDMRPSAKSISERAGVSVRSVFQHFDDLETLFTATSDRLGERTAALQMTVDPTLPLEERIPVVVRERSAMLEAITPFRRAANVHAPFADEVVTRLETGHAYLRSEVERIFATELDAVPPERRDDTLDALVAVLGWPMWDMLRTLGHRSVEEASAVMELLLRAIMPP